VVVGLAACGMTPFVHGALKQARQIGAATIFVTCAPEAVGHIPAEIVINPVVGPEVITGSTRMKAGTVKVYGNLMVDLQATNEKLRDRSLRIVMEMTNLSRSGSRKLLTRAQGKVKAAVVMHFRRTNLAGALKILDECDQFLRKAIEESS